MRTRFTTSLAEISSRDNGFYDIVAKWKGYFKTVTLTLTLTFKFITILTLAQAVKNEIFVSLAGQKIQNSFSLITPQGSIFTLRHVG